MELWSSVKTLLEAPQSLLYNKYSTLLHRSHITSFLQGKVTVWSDVETVLRGEGINLRDKTDTFRNFGDVLDEVAGKWDSYSSVSKNAISKAFAGTNHMEQFNVLMANYKKAQEYEKVSENSTGSTDKKYKVYEDSLEGRTEDLKNSFQSLSTTFANKNAIGFGVTGLSNFLNMTNKTVSSLGLLKTALVGIGAVKLFKNLG